MGVHHSKVKGRKRRGEKHNKKGGVANNAGVDVNNNVQSSSDNSTAELTSTTTNTTTTVTVTADPPLVVDDDGGGRLEKFSLRDSIVFKDNNEGMEIIECDTNGDAQCCKLCDSRTDKDKFYSLEFCGHGFCIPCIFAYSKEKLEELPDGACEMLCPLESCGCVISVVDLKRALATFGSDLASAQSPRSMSDDSIDGNGENNVEPIITSSLADITLPIQLTQSLEILLAKNNNYVRCPNPKCQFVFERLPPSRSNEVVLDDSGKPISPVALKHRQLNRFRCRVCDTNFCAGCKTAPYHLGFTCKEYFSSKAAKHCRFCDVTLPSNTKPYASGGVPISVPRKEKSKSLLLLWKSRGENKAKRKESKSKLKGKSAISSSGKEKGKGAEDVDEELANDGRPKEFYLCTGSECRDKMIIACYSYLPCGHYCGGYRGGSDTCMCLQPECSASPHDGDDYCSICWVEALKSAPTIKLNCGHFFHYGCVQKKLQNRWPGASISFAFASCPLCQAPISHYAFTAEMAAIDNLLREVKKKSVERLAIEGLQDDPQLITEGGKFYKNPEEFAMHVFAFYQCHLCKHAYFGGRRQCEEADNVDMSKHNPAELICGGCSTINAECAVHGRDYIDFKCRFCCSLATYFCGGKAHFCTPCHDKAGQLVEFTNWTTIATCPACKGGSDCPLGGNHAPNGEEFAMGCSMCKALAENSNNGSSSSRNNNV